MHGLALAVTPTACHLSQSCKAGWGLDAMHGLALSVKPLRVCQLSQRESLWRNQKLCRTAKASPFGRGGEERSDETERARLLI